MCILVIFFNSICCSTTVQAGPCNCSPEKPAARCFSSSTEHLLDALDTQSAVCSATEAGKSFKTCYSKPAAGLPHPCHEPRSARNHHLSLPRHLHPRALPRPYRRRHAAAGTSLNPPRQLPRHNPCSALTPSPACATLRRSRARVSGHCMASQLTGTMGTPGKWGGSYGEGVGGWVTLDGAVVRSAGFLGHAGAPGPAPTTQCARQQSAGGSRLAGTCGTVHRPGSRPTTHRLCSWHTPPRTRSVGGSSSVEIRLCGAGRRMAAQKDCQHPLLQLPWVTEQRK